MQVEDGLVPLIAKLREGAAPDTTVIAGNFDTTVQSELCNDIVKQLGFELKRGRLDVSVHPFTGGADNPSYKTIAGSGIRPSCLTWL